MPVEHVCFAAGDRGTVLKSTDGGNTWSFLAERRRQPDLRPELPDDDDLLRGRQLRHVDRDHQRRHLVDAARPRRSRRRRSTCRAPAARTRTRALRHLVPVGDHLRRGRRLHAVGPPSPSIGHDERRLDLDARRPRRDTDEQPLRRRAASRARRPASRSAAAGRSSTTTNLVDLDRDDLGHDQGAHRASRA